MGGTTLKVPFRTTGTKVENLTHCWMPTAPEMGLSNQDVRDIAEYLHTLKHPAPPAEAESGPGATRGKGWQTLVVQVLDLGYAEVCNKQCNKPDLDQSQFNLISLSGVKFWIDEIRIGTTFEAAIGGEDLADIDLVLSITQNTPTSRFLLSWPTRAGRAYNLRSSADLTGDVSTWTLVEQNIEPSETGTNTLEIDPAEGVLFYRIEEVVPVPEP